jgi:CheY-like chemotaxis protein
LRLSQVLTNLAGNAVKFTEKGEVEITVTANTAADGTGEVTFSVADSGVGIPDDKKHLLFQVFSQVDDSHSRIYGGTGLGLAISREIVERMGGTITFTSEVGKGSTFVCTIPLNKHEAKLNIAVPPSGEPQKTGEIAVSADFGKKRLLVVEDDDTIRQVLGLMLKRSNFEIDFAESGHEAVDAWEKGEFDLILMDVQMPGMNGFEATSLIREKERSRGGHTPIIAMTAHALKEDEEKCFAAGMDSYISKPIDFKKSLQMIRDLIARKDVKLPDEQKQVPL